MPRQWRDRLSFQPGVVVTSRRRLRQKDRRQAPPAVSAERRSDRPRTCLSIFRWRDYRLNALRSAAIANQAVALPGISFAWRSLRFSRKNFIVAVASPGRLLVCAVTLCPLHPFMERGWRVVEPSRDRPKRHPPGRGFLVGIQHHKNGWFAHFR